MPFYDYYYLFFEEYRVQMYDVRYMNSVGSISLPWSPNCEITGYNYGQDTKSPRIAMALNIVLGIAGVTICVVFFESSV